jgi:transposase
VTGQTLGDRVHRHVEEEGLRDRPQPARPCGLDQGQQAALNALVLRGPSLKHEGYVAWRLRDLRAVVERRFGVRYSESGLLRLA